MSNLSFIGLGIMGTPTVEHIVAKGHDVFPHTRRKVPAALWLCKAVAGVSVNQGTERADISFVMRPNLSGDLAVLLETDRVGLGLRQVRTVVTLRFIVPTALQNFAKAVYALGCDDLDASVSRGDVAAIARARLRDTAVGPWWLLTPGLHSMVESRPRFLMP